MEISTEFREKLCLLSYEQRGFGVLKIEGERFVETEQLNVTRKKVSEAMAQLGSRAQEEGYRPWMGERGFIALSNQSKKGPGKMQMKAAWCLWQQKERHFTSWLQYCLRAGVQITRCQVGRKRQCEGE